MTDDDTGTHTVLTTAFITGVGINNGVLQIVGTSGKDQVTVNRQGKGILLFHDRRLVTVKALLLLLDELKKRGFRVAHIVAKAQGVAVLRGASSSAP